MLMASLGTFFVLFLFSHIQDRKIVDKVLREFEFILIRWWGFLPFQNLMLNYSQ